MAVNINLARRKRRWLEITQAEMALRIGVHTVTFQSWERGLYEPTVTNAGAWARELGIDLNDLLSEGEPEEVAAS